MRLSSCVIGTKRRCYKCYHQKPYQKRKPKLQGPNPKHISLMYYRYWRFSLRRCALYPREGTHQKTPAMLGLAMQFPTPIHRLPVRDLPVTKHPLPLSLPLSTSYYNFSASPIQKPPLPLCEFNKSTLYFILDFHSAVLTSKKHPLKLVFGLSIVGKILMSPPLGTII